jgi:hypothetical protein
MVLVVYPQKWVYEASPSPSGTYRRLYPDNASKNKARMFPAQAIHAWRFKVIMANMARDASLQRCSSNLTGWYIQPGKKLLSDTPPESR